jgi:putative restriction endonuclease
MSTTQETPTPRVWLVLTFGRDRTYAGNLGYADDPRRLYRYDNFVQNHSRVVAGDVFVIRNRQSLLGLARVAEIRSSKGEKTRRRCTSCGSTSFTERTSKHPRFRCSQGHEFDAPELEQVPCINHEAHLIGYIEAQDALPIPILRAACLRYASQTSIQEIDPDAIRWGLDSSAPSAVSLLPAPRSVRYLSKLSPDEAFDREHSGTNARGERDQGLAEQETDVDFVPGDGDERDLVERAIRLRRGQARFRRSLIAQYGARCMISKCALLHLVEAAHIAPFRRKADHSVANGLLLRADLHTLFDLDLLGVNPATLLVHLHPSVREAGYAALEGAVLQHGVRPPSRAALTARWDRFEERMQRP